MVYKKHDKVGSIINGFEIVGIERRKRVSKSYPDTYKLTYFKCVCVKCGYDAVFRACDVLKGKTHPCSACRLMKKHKLHLGYRFGRLTIKSVHNNGSGSVRFVCLCDCGTTKELSSSQITAGSTNSCGCLHKDLLRSTVVSRTEKRVKARNTNPIANKSSKTGIKNISEVHKGNREFYCVAMMRKGITLRGKASTLEDALKVRESIVLEFKRLGIEDVC